MNKNFVGYTFTSGARNPTLRYTLYPIRVSLNSGDRASKSSQAILGRALQWPPFAVAIVASRVPKVRIKIPKTIVFSA